MTTRYTSSICCTTLPRLELRLHKAGYLVGWLACLKTRNRFKVLTLINNERITMPDQVSLLFEVQDLTVASPATVSRAGMVYNDYKNLGWRPHVDSWLHKYDTTPEFVEEVRRCSSPRQASERANSGLYSSLLFNQMNQLFESHVNDVLEYKRQYCDEIVPVPELNAVQSLCKLLEVLATPQNGVELGEDRDAYSVICKMWFFFWYTHTHSHIYI